MPPTAGKSAKGAWTAIIRSVTTPIGFFVLAVLVGEPALALVLSCAKLSEEHVWCGLIVMLSIFVFLILIITLFTWLNPKHLLYGKEEHLNQALEISALKDQIEDLITKRVRPESLKTDQDRS
jgi:hypothetical protein